MENKIQLPQPRLEQLRSLIKIEAEKKIAAATKIINDKKELNYTLQNDGFNYSELFEALDTFNFDHYDVFYDIALISKELVANPNAYKKNGLLWTLAAITTLLNVISSKKVFIGEKRQEYVTLLEDLQQLQDVHHDPDRF